MTKEFSEKLFNILLDISRNLEPLYFWNDYVFWIGLINVLFLSLTLYWLIRYTRATERMAGYQFMPAVDVNMIYNKDRKETYFWFTNTSSTPALVSIAIKKKVGVTESEHTVSPLRIPPNNPHYYQARRTGAIDFLGLNISSSPEVVVKITVASAFDDTNDIKSSFTKSYRFNSSEYRWDETTWGYPDLPPPTINHQK